MTAEVVPSAGGAAVSEDEVRERVLSVVAEKTGYPQDMLDLELDMEADLGIDTVKQAELLRPCGRPTASNATTSSS